MLGSVRSVALATRFQCPESVRYAMLFYNIPWFSDISDVFSVLPEQFLECNRKGSSRQYANSVFVSRLHAHTAIHDFFGGLTIALVRARCKCYPARRMLSGIPNACFSTLGKE